MRILIYGAGVIGSLYAALLADAGYDTSIYARGKRLEILKNDGLLYKKNQDLIKAKIKILEEVPDEMRELHKQFYAYLKRMKACGCKVKNAV